MLLKSMRDGQAMRSVDGYFAQARLPLRLGAEAAEAAFVTPLSRELDRIGLGRVAGFDVSLDDEGEPERLDIHLSLVTDAPRAMHAVAGILETLEAPVGSCLGNAECDSLVEFGKAEGLGLYLPAQETRDVDRLAVIAACTEALNGAGLFQGSWSVGDRTALYFYGDSFNKMKNAITYVMTTDPRCRNAFARRLN